MSYHGKLGSVVEIEQLPLGEARIFAAKLQEVRKEEKEAHDREMQGIRQRSLGRSGRSKAPGAFMPKGK